MAEFINREAFKKSVEERYCNPCKAEGKDHNGCRCRSCWVDDMLDEVECFQPSDVAPVVRCKDCAHRGWVQEPCEDMNGEGAIQDFYVPVCPICGSEEIDEFEREDE